MKNETITMMRLRSLDPASQVIETKTQEVEDFKFIDGDLYIIKLTDGEFTEHVIASGVWVECETWEVEK